MKNKIKVFTTLLVLALIFVGCSQDEPKTADTSPTQNQGQEVISNENEPVDPPQAEEGKKEENSQDMQEPIDQDSGFYKLDQALAFALEDLGLSQNEVIIKEASFDRDSYDFDIYHQGTDYEYELSHDFQIIEKSQENYKDAIDTSLTYLALEDVLDRVFDHVGLNEEDISELNLDLDGGPEPLYEVDIESNQGEYEFYIDPISGQIR